MVLDINFGEDILQSECEINRAAAVNNGVSVVYNGAAYM